MHKKKKVWISVIVIVAAIVILYFVLKSPQTGTNVNNNNENASAPNQNAPSSASTPKTNLALYYNLDWQKDYIDKPNNIVSISISGNYNAINISSQTEISQVTLSGTNNKITFCNSTYPAPVINKIGINNVINYVVC
ncbi:MAG: hypothetical protein ABSG05_00675 [Candidatus Pacearchaeota archaeon]|jgi:hypothetical protein